MADRNRYYGYEDDRRGQGSRDWEEGRQRYGEWRAGRGDEGRGDEGRGYEEDRDSGRTGREEFVRGYGEDFGRGGYGGEGRFEEERGGYGRMGREDMGRGGSRSGRFLDPMDSGRAAFSGGDGRRGFEGRGYEDRGYEDRGFEDRDSGRWGRDMGGMGRGSAPIPRERYGADGIGPSSFAGGRSMGMRSGSMSGGISGVMGRTSEDINRGRATFMGGGFGGMEPDMGRDYRPEDYGRGEDSWRGEEGGRAGGLRSIGYGMARMGMGEGERRMGRGPKNYQRSDDRIREDICERLMQGWMNAESVDVQVRGGEVTLLGTVDSRAEKRAIEDVAEGVLGVGEVHNQLRVRRAGMGTEVTQGTVGTQPAQASASPTGDTGRKQDTERTGTSPQPSLTSPLHS